MLTPRTSFRTSPEAVGWLSVGPRRHSARLGGSTVLAGRDARQSPRASVLSRSIRASGLGNSKRGMGGLLQLARSASVPGVRGSGSGSSSSSSSATSAHREDMDDTAVSSSRRARRAHSRRALSKARGGKGLYSALCAHCDRPAARTKGEEGSRGSELSAR
mmetsp:Transcript_7512/g.22543  ORF Transcript_7512/g.22543 Transcript_7512/m.22543 type:complete len:161 (-) Transcript_7512:124-606(-)